MSKISKNVKKVSDEILDDWFGPSGQCWSEEKQKFVDPEESDSCKILNQTDHGRTYRYLHLHDDYKSY